VPSMSIGRAVLLARLIADHGLARVLELGCQHGKGTAYLAATLRALGPPGGALTTVDRDEALSLRPTVHEVLAALGLRDLVAVHIEPRSLTWRLMRFLEAGPEPRFDLCYIDAAHSWDVTGLAFLLVDRLLAPGGWVVLDDLDWTYERMLPPGEPPPAWLARMPAEEVGTPQVRKVWELLVRRHRALFERLPPRAELERLAPPDEAAIYLARRLLILCRKWRPLRVVPCGEAAAAWLAAVASVPEAEGLRPLLGVEADPGYGDFAERDGCGIARKRAP
jgi:predicted O-methyltransferase YrrM